VEFLPFGLIIQHSPSGSSRLYKILDSPRVASRPSCHQGLEGIVAKREDSLYEPGQRTGAWIKSRVNRGQEFVIGGYFPGPHGFDSLIVGYYDQTN
jgi:ATP-dependent DNA ligase